MSDGVYYLFAAVLLVWIGTFLYVSWIVFQQKKLIKEVSQLEESFETSSKK